MKLETNSYVSTTTILNCYKSHAVGHRLLVHLFAFIIDLRPVEETPTLPSIHCFHLPCPYRFIIYTAPYRPTVFVYTAVFSYLKYFFRFVFFCFPFVPGSLYCLAIHKHRNVDFSCLISRCSIEVQVVQPVYIVSSTLLPLSCLSSTSTFISVVHALYVKMS